MLYGYPGAGKTYFSRQFCEHIQAAHLEQDRIRFELFDEPRFTKQENFVVGKLMDFMASEFLAAGVSVVYDMNAMRLSQRLNLRELCNRNNAKSLVVWFQVDPDTAYLRNAKRDRRSADDRYSVGYDVEQFKQLLSYMQNPEPVEDYLVISGKHSFPSQLSSISRKLADLGVLKRDSAATKMVKPELVNLVPPQHIPGQKTHHITPYTPGESLMPHLISPHIVHPMPEPEPEKPVPTRRNIVLR